MNNFAWVTIIVIINVYWWFLYRTKEKQIRQERHDFQDMYDNLFDKFCHNDIIKEEPSINLEGSGWKAIVPTVKPKVRKRGTKELIDIEVRKKRLKLMKEEADKIGQDLRARIEGDNNGKKEKK